MSGFAYGMNGGSSSAYPYDPTGTTQLMGAANYLGSINGLSSYLGAYNSATATSQNSTGSLAAGALATSAQTSPTDAANRLALGWHNENN